MVDARVTDGYRIAELLASEIDGRRSGPLGRLAVANPDRTVSGSPAGERAYDVLFLEDERDPRREPTPDAAGPILARAFVHEEGASVAVYAGVAAAERTARDAGLQAGPAAGPGEGPAFDPASGPESDPVAASPASDATTGYTVLTVEYGAQVKRVADALSAASAAYKSAD